MNTDGKRAARRVSLRVPIDASQIEDRGGLKSLRALLIMAGGKTQSTEVKFDAKGHAEAAFELPSASAARVIVGPADADDDQLQGLQTLKVDVPLRSWDRGDKLQLAPLQVLPWYWHWWLRWCRTFTIRGRVLCPDGNPVPGARVCAFDVDRFWWWHSEQHVGCATTDATGSFSITFRWCCGWLPWWWWRRRLWRVDPKLSDRIVEELQRVPDLPIPPAPDPAPDFAVFDRILSGGSEPRRAAMRIDDPGRLDALRPQLQARLPAAPHLEALRIWPWAPWHPWWDCSPDINFRITQDCGQGAVTILDEGLAETRWNIPTQLDVTLVASDEACCIQPRDPRCPDGDCVVLSHICDDLVSTVGGNIGAPAAPAGYRSPGLIATGGDRPYAGVVPVKGICADWIDYYEFERSTDGVTWTPMGPDETGGFTVHYFNPGGPPWFIPVTFSFATVDGRWVIETIGHWESVNGVKPWVGDITTLIRWITAKASSPTGPTALVSDGTYHLRLRGWRDNGGTLVDLGTPPLCGTQNQNGAVVTIDNRRVGPAAGHPTAPDHPVGGVHLATTEPDTDFIQIRINGNPVGPCAIVSGQTGTLEIDFLAHDPDGHLAYYTLDALWGENNRHSLLNKGTLTRIAAAQAGPNYGAARAGLSPENMPAAAAPVWHGGRMRLTIDDIRTAFPDPCCYLLDLHAYKRTINSCDDDYTHRNRSTFTFTVS